VPQDTKEENSMFQYCQAPARWGPHTTTLPPPAPIKDAVLALDRRFTIIGCDATAPALFGHERRRLLGSHVSTLIPDIKWPSQFLQESAEERWGHLRFSRLGLEACRADGGRFPITASLLQDADGNLLLRVRRLDA
jgi:PAS domain-containing protein